MKSRMKIWVPASILELAMVVALAAAVFVAGAQAPSLFRGTITGINGSAITVKTDAGEVREVEIPAKASLKRVAPGQKDLSSAETIQLSDLTIGDRVLVWPDPKAAGTTTQALRLVAIKQEDLAKKQQKDREDWQQRGVGGLVKNVDGAGGVIVLTSGSGAAAKTITVHAAKTTVLKRYSPTSIRFDDAQAAPIDAIHAGDQLRARGIKSADGTDLTAEEVVSGSFRNISGTIASLDTATSTLVLKDLATKKQVTIHITADAQMRQLPERMAQMLAMRLKGGAGGLGANAESPNGTVAVQRGGAGPGGGAQFGAQGGPGRLDPEQMLSHAPAIKFADLLKGEAVMLVSTQGATEVTAITLLAGVEPLLEAPAASNLLSNWSMNSGAEMAQ
jgi:hypothetical protein